MTGSSEDDSTSLTKQVLVNRDLLWDALAQPDDEWLYVLGDSGRIEYMSPSTYRLTGYSPAEFIADPSLLLSVMHPEDRGLMDRHLNPASPDDWTQFDFRLIHRNGECRWMGHACNVVRTFSGEVIGRRVANRDITHRKRAEEMLVLQRDIALALSGTRDVAGSMTKLLELVCSIPSIDSGGVYTVEEGSGDLVLVAHRGLGDDFVQMASRHVPGSPQWRLANEGKVAYGPYSSLRTTDDQAGMFEELRCLICVPVMHQGGLVAVINLASHSSDTIPLWARLAVESIAVMIGETVARARAEEALAARDQDMRLLFDAIEDMLFVLTMDGRVSLTNAAVLRRLGYTREELGVLHVLDLHPAERRPEALAIVQAMLAGGATLCHVPLVTKSGEFVPVETQVARGTLGGQPVLIGVSRDLTALRRAEDQAVQLGRILEFALHEIYVFAADGHEVLFVNRGARANLGYPIGSSGPRVWGDLSPQFTSSWLLATLAPLMEGSVERLTFHAEHQRQDGTRYPVEVFVQRSRYEGREAFAVFVTDITEMRRTEGALRVHAQAQETLLGEVNHRVKNNLASILSVLHRQEARAVQQGNDSVSPIVRDLEARIRVLATVHDMLSTGGWKPVLLTALCERIVHAVIRAAHEVEGRVLVRGDELWVSSGEAHHIALVVNELCMNAIKHGGVSPGELEIAIAIEVSDGQVRLIFKDNGCGYPMEFLRGEGATGGTGLLLVRGITRSTLRGRCELKNAGGAVAELHFPEPVLEAIR